MGGYGSQQAALKYNNEGAYQGATWGYGPKRVRVREMTDDHLRAVLRGRKKAQERAAWWEMATVEVEREAKARGVCW